jgi:hypothetical protein
LGVLYFHAKRRQEIKALDKQINVEGLENLAQSTWQDSLDWSILSQLLKAQRNTVQKDKNELAKIAKLVSAEVTAETERLTTVLSELGEIEGVVSNDFPTRGQNISSLVRGT